jgi:hypothetical protein
MNIALGALIITILLLPGAITLRAYYNSFTEKDTELHIPFSELLFRGLLLSLLIHTVSILLMHLAGLNVDYKLLYQITIADKFGIQNIDFTRSFLQFGLYNITLIVVLYSGTKVAKRIIVDNNWDITFHSLRTSNFWFLIFSGRYLDANKKGRRKNTDIIWVDVMVPEQMVYSGYLFDFEYSPGKDKLETITLKNASKRTYRKSLTDEDRKEADNKEQNHPLKLDKPRPIQGDAFVILAEEILNLNLYYLNIEEIGSASG